MASRDIKVGIFVFAGLLMAGLVIFLIGDERKMFAQHETIEAAFKDVKGLSRGSPVRMGGVDIGRVVELGYGASAEDDTIYVKMEVVTKEAARIRADSLATVEGKGFLGDMMVVISVGSPEQPQIPSGELIPSKESRDIAEMIADLRKVAAGADRIVANLERTSETLADEKLNEDVKKAVANISGVLESLNSNQGYIGRLLNSPEEAENISQTVRTLRQSAGELEDLLASTRAIMGRVEEGPGLAHSVIYEETGAEALAQIGGAADELGTSIREMRQGKSLAHELLFGEDSGKIVANIEATTSDVRAITSDIRSGKGSLGAFLVDPSVYEDVKVLLGNVGRNRSLKALVRYSISQDEKSGRVVDKQGQKQKISSSAASAARD